MNKQPSVNASYRWVILASHFSVQAVVSTLWFSFGPLAPFLIDAFHITRAQVGWFVSMNSLALMLFSMPAGWLVDRFGIRRLLLYGAGILGLLYMLFSRVPNAATGYVIIFAAGMGYVFTPPTTTMGLVHWFSPKERATAVSIKQSGMTIGTAIGAVLIPSLSLLVGWRNTVATLGMSAVMIAIVSSAIYRERNAIKASSQPSPFKAFRRVLTDRALLHLGFVGTAYTALQFCVTSYLMLQLVETRGMSEVLAGTFLMATNLGGAAGRVVFGFFSDRIFHGQRGRVLALIGIISGTTALFLSAASNTGAPSVLYLAVILFGFTGLGWNGVYLTFASELSSKESAATGLGCALTVMTIGGVIGPPLFGYIVDRTSSYSLAWQLFGVCAVVAALSMVWVKKRETQKDYN